MVAGDELAGPPEPEAREPLDAATPEQVDLVFALAALNKASSELRQNLMSGVPVAADEWAALADLLSRAARLCRQQIILEPDDDARGPS